MRIGSGSFGGRVLRTPKGEGTRPTSGLVRETLFNILAADIPDAIVLDLYAGCGSVGLEALSRGAARTTLVEKNRPAIACLQGNITMLGVTAKAAVLPIPVERALPQLVREKQTFDLIFLDPPFANQPAYLAVLDQVAAGRLLASDGVLVAQHDARVDLPPQVANLTRYRVQRIGDNALSFYREG